VLGVFSLWQLNRRCPLSQRIGSCWHREAIEMCIQLIVEDIKRATPTCAEIFASLLA